MQSDIRIDYLQFSADHKKYRFLTTNTTDDIKPIPYYTVGSRYANGVRVYKGNVNTDKTLFVLDGKTCSNNFINMDDVLKSVHRTGNIARLDIAVTTDINLIDIVYKNPDKVRCRDKWRDVTAICGNDYRLETVYYGNLKKRGRNGLVRVYDKALEMGVDGISLYRAEIELRRADAQTALNMLVDDVKLTDVFVSFFDADHDIWRQVTQHATGFDLADYASSRLPDDVAIRRWIWWLIEQVAPTVAKVLHYDAINGTDNMARYLDQVDRKLVELQNKK